MQTATREFFVQQGNKRYAPETETETYMRAGKKFTTTLPALLNKTNQTTHWI
jgi:hypothetical protein